MIEKLYKVIEDRIITVQDIAEKYHVSERTVNRWLTKTSKPKIEVQIEIEGLIDSGDIRMLNSDNRKLEDKLKAQIDGLLTSLRESFHRWGRYSSRNEALEELCKLILAQFSLIRLGEKGLHQYRESELNKDGSEMLIDSLNKAIERILGGNIELHLQNNGSYKLSIDSSQSILLGEICKHFKSVSWKEVNSLQKLDLFNEIFGKFLSNTFIDEKELGQYLTPIEMTRFMVELLVQELSEIELSCLTHPEKCREFGYIMDPSCGAGSFLTELVHHLVPRVIKEHGEQAAQKWLENMGKHVLCGIDKSNRMLRLTIYNFSIMGIPCDNIYSLNSLDLKQHGDILVDKLKNKVSLILTNPPFGAEFSGKILLDYKLFTKWSKLTPKKIDSELLFIERYIDWLKVGGRCITVVPDSVLTNRGIYSNLRAAIHHCIEIISVISFPFETFIAAGTSTKTSVLFFVKDVPDNRKTYFAICGDIGYKVITKGSKKIKIATNSADLSKILEEASGNISETVIGRRILFDDSFDRWDATYHASLTGKEYQLLESKSDLLKLSEIADLVNERIDPRRFYSSYQYIEISDIQKTGIVTSKIIKALDTPSRARKRVRVGDVLASTVRPDQKKIGFILDNRDDDAICTTGLAVLRPIDIEPGLLVELLKTDFVTRQLMRFNIGIAYPTIDETCFLEVILPIRKSQLKYLNATAEEVRVYRERLLHLEANYKKSIEEIKNEWMQSFLIDI